MLAAVRVLGIDPGLTRCGVGVVDARPGRRVELVAVSVIRSPATLPTDRRLLEIAEALEDWIGRTGPDAVAVERVFAQENLRTVIGTAQVAGLVMVAAARRGIAVGVHTPSEVKAAVTGYGRAGKAQVQEMVSRILGLDERPRPPDAADALALAICHAWRPLTASGVGPAQRGVAAVLTPAQRAWSQAEQAARRRW